MRQAACAAGRFQIAFLGGRAVPGHLQQVGPDGVEAVPGHDPLVGANGIPLSLTVCSPRVMRRVSLLALEAVEDQVDGEVETIVAGS